MSAEPATTTPDASDAAPARRERRAEPAAPRRRADDRYADALRREVIGIATLALCLCFMLALVSFDPADLTPQGIAADGGGTANLIGPVGASVADIIFSIFGIAAFLLPMTLAIPGYCFLVGKRVQVRPVDALGYPTLVLCGAMLAHMWLSGAVIMGHGAGGAIGSTGAEIIRSLFGSTGAYILIYALLALTLVLTTQVSLVATTSRAAGHVRARYVARSSSRPSAEAPAAPRKSKVKAAAPEVEAESVSDLAAPAARSAQTKPTAQPTSDAPEKSLAQRLGESLSRGWTGLRGRFKRDPATMADLTQRAEPSLGSRSEPTVARAAKRAPKATPVTENAEPARRDSGFEFGGVVNAASPSDGFRMGSAPAAESPEVVVGRPTPIVRVPTSMRDATRPERKPSNTIDAFASTIAATTGESDADEDHVEFDDPLDQEAVSGARDTWMGDAVQVASARGAGAPVRGPSPLVPIVMPRRSGPRVEQLEMPLAGSAWSGEFALPPLNLLDYNDPETVDISADHLQLQADRLVRALETYKIQGRVTEIHPGPVVTVFEFKPADGVRVSKIASLADDLAMALEAVKVRIVAPIPGKGVVGFEVPNERRETVWLKEIIGDERFRSKKNILPLALGKGIDGTPEVADLAKMPHLLVAGTTGSGKSVGVNGMITSLLYHASPEDVRFLMVDPKMLELSIYEGIPHLLLPVVTDPKKAAAALRWACDEMDRRYELMMNAGVRDIRGYNAKIAGLAPVEPAPTMDDPPFDADGGLEDAEPVAIGRGWAGVLEERPTKLPYIVVVIDEFADLMMVAGKEVEFCVGRIAQKARAAGIHLILATQRPSTDVITGVIKANFPTRIAFQVSSGIDSRTILQQNGAEQLLGKGDMLFVPPGTGHLRRVHGAFVSEDEIHKVVEFIRTQGEPQYMDESVLRSPDDASDDADGDDGDMDPLYEECVRLISKDGRASTSHLQRRLSLGYNRAARIIDQMERDGLLGPGDGAKPRNINKRLMAELIARWDGTSAMLD